MGYTEPRWVKWGLMLDDAMISGRDGNHAEAVRTHNLVAAYLERHPEAAAEYRADQSGTLRYFDILALAEAEARPA